MTTEDTFGTDFTRNARHFRGERVELIDHRIDRAGEFANLAPRFDRDFFRKVAVGDGGGYVGDIANLGRKITRHGVDRVGQIFPRAGNAFDGRLTTELAFGADLARNARDFRRERVEPIDHLVDRAAGAQKLAFEWMTVGLERHLLRKVAVGDRTEHAPGFRHREDQIIDQLVDRLDSLAPIALHAVDGRALGDRAFTPDDFAYARKFVIDTRVVLDAFIERIGDLAVDTDEIIWQARAEISVAKSAQGREQRRLM